MPKTGGYRNMTANPVWGSRGLGVGSSESRDVVLGRSKCRLRKGKSLPSEGGIQGSGQASAGNQPCNRLLLVLGSESLPSRAGSLPGNAEN